MGVESYLMRLQGNQSDLDEVIHYSRRMFGIALDLDQSPLSSAYSHYVYRDDLHIIEFEFFQASGYYEVSIRFALCSPTSIDQVFIAQALELMRSFNLTATICEELPEQEPREYKKECADRFSENCSWSIARSRAYWQQLFGTEEVGLSVSDALRKFFLGESFSR